MEAGRIRGLFFLASVALTVGLPSSAIAQQFTAGIKVGGQITDVFSATVPSPSFDHFIFGPEAGIALPHGFGLEFDALHQHYAYAFFIIGPLHNAIAAFNTHISYWDFPLLLKWRVAEHKLSPFVAAGLSQRHTGGTGLLPVPLSQNPVLVFSTSLSTWTRGPVLGGGGLYTIGHFHISPQLRYTHWSKPAVVVPGQSSMNEVDALLGLTIGTH